ncbi:MAG: protein kinase [Ectothiorhodospiraceae bacterium]|nr:protein kinase [Chromatiales bacterium]MCP5153290.1 protein kinase [Ectothiorhodospiraceae bacterium]
MEAAGQAFALRPGTRVDSFEIQSVLGTGGFGITYKAHDYSLERAVALKEYFPSGLAERGSDRTTIAPRTDDSSDAFEYGLSRFLAEARVLAQFQEPSIVRVSRYLEANGTAYLVMDYEEGQPLGRVLARIGRLSERQATAVLVHICRGLVSVHDKRFLHRDIKPANILVRRSGPPVLLDFGAARLALEQQRGAVTVLLTPGYAPLEQYTTDGELGPWTDLYGLGATLFHCVAGEIPATATQRAAAMYDGTDDPVNRRLNDLRGQYSDAFLDTVAWMLEAQAADRAQCAEDVLARVVDGRLGGSRTRGAGAATWYGVPSDEPTRFASPTPRGTGRGGPPPRDVVRDPRPGTGGRPSGGIRTGARDSAGGTSTGGRSREQVTPTLCEAAERLMAEYVGPIARVLVDRIASSAPDRRAFLDALVDELDDESERREFLSRLRELDRV